MATVNTDNLLTTDQAAEILGLEPGSVKKYCQSGKIAALKLGRSWMIPKHSLKGFSSNRKAVGRPKK